MANIKAVRDTIIVRAEFDKNIGSIIVPDIALKHEDAFKGIVESVGPEYPYDVKKGDTIRFRRNEGTPVIVDGVEYLCLQEKWVDCKEEGK